MSDNTVILCPGQGAQRAGMGRAWFDASPAAAQTFAAADEILGDRLGATLSQLCFEGPADELNKTNVSQPAIFVTSVACRQAMLADDAPVFDAPRRAEPGRVHGPAPGGRDELRGRAGAGRAPRRRDA